LIASLLFLPPDPVETDYREAFLEGDQALFAGENQELIAAVFKKRGFDSAELPPEFQGELVEGVAETRSLGADDFDVWIFSELPPAQQVVFDTTGTGDVDLFVVPIDFDEMTPLMFSAGFGSTESVQVSPFSAVSIDDEDAWLVFVFDAPGGGSSSYTLGATATPRTDDIAIGGSASGFIADPDEEIDWFQFSGTAGQYVRAAVTATGFSTIDPFVAVLTYEPFEVLDTDDDSGDGAFGLDALLQGVLLPSTGRYVVAVLSVASDFDPFVGTGSYQLSLSLCDNTIGDDSDGDGAHDLCDQDDDDDGFVDAEDADPLDPVVCTDIDGDGCNDCSSGSFDFRNDGIDSDLDVACDLGDDDDDNDGCADDVDLAFPTTPSLDDDLDFLGLDCDNCPDVPNPVQEDADADGAGDACSACARVDWQEPPSLPPDQNPAEASLQLSVKNGLGALRASGVFNPAGAGPLDPSASGVQVRLADANGALLDVFVPGAAPPCEPGDGWTVKDTRFSYANRSGALPPFCALGSAQGLTSLRITDDRAGASAALLYRITAKNVPLAEGLANPARFVQLDLAFGEPPAAGQPSPEGAAGVCAESVLRVGVQGTRCKLSQKNGVLSSLSCTGP
jgi:hypothetical protein